MDTSLDGREPRVLVLQTRRLGDVLMITPLLRALAHGLPGARVDVLVEPASAPALAANPHVSALVEAGGPVSVLALRLRQTRYDVVVDAMGKSTSALLAWASGAPRRIGFSSSRFSWCYTDPVALAGLPTYSAHQKLALLTALGIRSADVRLQLPGGQADRLAADAWWQALPLGDRPQPIACAPVSRRLTKQWPAERFARVLEAIAERTARPLLLFHGEGEAPQVEAVMAHVSDRLAFIHPRSVLPFASLPAALARCAGYVGNDNGIRHLAVGLGLPTLAVFGRPSPANWTPPDAAHHLAVGGRRDIRTIAVEEVIPLAERFARLL